jgi:hypothetical protein
VWAWVLAGMTVFWLAVRLVIKVANHLTATWSRRWNFFNPLVVLVVFAVIPVTLGDYRAGAGPWFWVLYAILFQAALAVSLYLDFPFFWGLLITTWVLGFISEYAGSVPNHIWTFTYNPDYPPFFLIAGCWPLEIFTQLALAAFLAHEPLDSYTY